LSPTDLAFDLVSGIANPLMGMIRHPRSASLQQRTIDEQPVVPMMDPVTTPAEIAKAATARLPGSSGRRCLSCRYTLW
jgi:hypothetical protein